MLEKEGYRENLEFLSSMFPGRATLTVKEAAGIMSCTINTVYAAVKRRRFPLPSQKLGGKTVIPIPSFARWMAGGDEKRSAFR
jgi:hypothetical protein